MCTNKEQYHNVKVPDLPPRVIEENVIKMPKKKCIAKQKTNIVSK